MALGCLRFLAVRPWKSLQCIWNIAFGNLWYKMLEYDKYRLVGVSLLLFLFPSVGISMFLVLQEKSNFLLEHCICIVSTRFIKVL